MDYKELIRRLDNCGKFDGDLLDDAATAIETLLTEREAVLRAQQTPLNRIRWEGCEYCKDIPASILKGFCYACGRPLTEEAWAELERRIT